MKKVHVYRVLRNEVAVLLQLLVIILSSEHIVTRLGFSVKEVIFTIQHLAVLSSISSDRGIAYLELLPEFSHNDHHFLELEDGESPFLLGAS